MDSKLLYLTLNVVFLGAWSTSLPSPRCPNKELYAPCNCFNEHGGRKLWIMCSDVSADDIRVVMGAVKVNNKDIYQLTVRNKFITSLPENVFEDAVISVIHLETPSLMSLHPNVFTGQRNTLVSLSVKSSNMSSIPVQTFSSLKNLNSIWIGSSKHLELIDRNTFDGLSNIENIDFLTITGGGIRKIEDGTFSNFTKLAFLRLEDNELEELSVGTLPAHKLKGLSLRGNNLSRFPTDLVAKLKENSFLTLEGMNITKISPEQIDAVIRNRIIVFVKNNPLDCDCGFKRLAEKLEISPYDYVIQGKCKSPKKLASQSIFNLRPQNYTHCD